MDEQLLKDFLATAQADNYNWDVIMPKFPELADINLQVLKDYSETAIKKNYDYATINPLFPELFSAQDVKKKEETDMVSESVSGLSVLPSGEKDTLLEETFGKNEVTDFFGDLYRSGVQGVAQGATVDDALKIFSQGKEADSQDIEDYIKAVQGMESMPASDEMRSFQEIYQRKGGGLMGFMAGIYENPSVLPQIFTSSVASMIQPASVGAGVALGAAAGAATGGVGALPGFVAGLSGSLETALAFTEFLKEEMK